VSKKEKKNTKKVGIMAGGRGKGVEKRDGGKPKQPKTKEKGQREQAMS